MLPLEPRLAGYLPPPPPPPPAPQPRPAQPTSGPPHPVPAVVSVPAQHRELFMALSAGSTRFSLAMACQAGCHDAGCCCRCVRLRGPPLPVGRGQACRDRLLAAGCKHCRARTGLFTLPPLIMQVACVCGLCGMRNGTVGWLCWGSGWCVGIARGLGGGGGGGRILFYIVLLNNLFETLTLFVCRSPPPPPLPSPSPPLFRLLAEEFRMEGKPPWKCIWVPKESEHFRQSNCKVHITSLAHAPHCDDSGSWTPVTFKGFLHQPLLIPATATPSRSLSLSLFMLPRARARACVCVCVCSFSPKSSAGGLGRGWGGGGACETKGPLYMMNSRSCV